jgi:hypothetical protein
MKDKLTFRGIAIDYTQDVNVYNTIKNDYIEAIYNILELKAVLDKIIELKLDIKSVDSVSYSDIVSEVYKQHKQKYAYINNYLNKNENNFFDVWDENNIMHAYNHKKAEMDDMKS